jgi:hypothetical protein
MDRTTAHLIALGQRLAADQRLRGIGCARTHGRRVSGVMIACGEIG